TSGAADDARKLGTCGAPGGEGIGAEKNLTINITSQTAEPDVKTIQIQSAGIHGDLIVVVGGKRSGVAGHEGSCTGGDAAQIRAVCNCDEQFARTSLG